MKRQICLLFSYSLSKIVVFHDSWKDLNIFSILIFSKSCNYLFVFVIRFSMNIALSRLGGLKWTRTTDLVLIRHAL